MKWNQPNLFSEEQLDAMVTSRSGKPMIKSIDRHGNTFYYPDNHKTLADFVEQARKIWGDQYDYTDSVYTNNKKPITIRCRKHGHYFTVAMAQNHIMKPHGKFKPTGCPVCSYEQQYGEHFGTDWRKYLEPTPGQNRVRRIYQPKINNKHRSPEQIAAEKAKREAKAEARRREEQAYIDRWKAKNLKEAHFLERLQNRYPNMYDTHLVDYKDNSNRVTLICPMHGEFRITSRQLFGDKRHKPHGCWRCAGLEDPDTRPAPMTADEFFLRMHELYDATELDFLTSEFKNTNAKVTAYCRKHGAITHPAKYWLEGKGCEYCNGKFYPQDFLQMARKAQGREYTYRGVNKIVSTASRVMVHCGNPNHKWHRMIVWLVLQGSKCRECAGRHQPLEQRCQEWIAKCIEKYGEGRYDYSRAHEDYVNNDSLVWIRCCLHDHWFKTTPDNNLRTVNGSCPICSAEFTETQGEAEIRRWLEKHGITNFKQDEVTLPNENPRCSRQYLRPDFWLPDYNLFIEYNGEQHYENVEYFFDDDFTFEDQQIRDQTLRDYCHRHGHNLLEIPYWDFQRIGEILTDELLNH